MQAIQGQHVGLSSEFEEGAIVARKIGGTDLIFVRSRGKLRCFLDECSHQPVRLSDFGEVRGDRLTCHAHGGGFDLSCGGRAVCGPPRESLKEYRCIESSGQVSVII